MTHPQPTPRLDAAIEGYVVAVFREVVRIAAVTRYGIDADDVASEIAAEVLEHPESVMARYPDPLRYARSRVRHAGIGYDRRQRVQRGEGVRLRTGPDGLLHPTRAVVSGNATAPDGGDELFAMVCQPGIGFDEAADERIVALVELQRCCEGIAAHALRELWLVDGCGYTVNEVAELQGQRRETISRRLNDTRRRIRQNRADMLARRVTP